MENKQQWAEMEMPSDEEVHPHHQEEQKEENPTGQDTQNSAGVQISMARNPKRKPHLSKEEIIEKIKTFKGHVFLNLLNVDYKATETDLLELYSYVKVKKLEKTEQKGIFLMLVEDANEALKLFTEEEKTLNGRKITVRLSAPRKREPYERTEGNFNKERRPEGGFRDKKFTGERNFNNNKERDFKGSYNRKEFHEQAQYVDEGSFQFQKQKREKPLQTQEEKPNVEPEKKPEESTRKPFGFTRAGGAPKDKKDENPASKPQKSNPFGAAKARDENEYIKKRREEGKVSEKLEEIKELKGTQLEKAPVKSEEKPKVVEQKREEEEFIPASKAKKGPQRKPAEKVEAKEVPKVQESNEKAKKEQKKPTTTQNLFSQLAGDEEEEFSDH